MHFRRPTLSAGPGVAASVAAFLGLAVLSAGCGSNSNTPAFERKYDHYVMVADTNNNRIVLAGWDTTTGAIDTTTWKTLGGLTPGTGFGQFDHPTVIRQDNFGGFWIADTGNNRVVFMTDIEGHNWQTFGTLGSGQGQFNQPHGMAFFDNHIYIADSGNNRIVRIGDINGADWTTFGSAGNGVGQFNYPYDVNTFFRFQQNSYDGLAVSDTNNDRVVFFDLATFSTKDWLNFTGPAGGASLSFNHPTGLSVNKYFYVADTGNNRIVFSEISGGTATNSYSGNLNGPMDYTGLWVADTNNNRLIKVDVPLTGAGTATLPFGTNGTGVGQFDHPSSSISFAEAVPNDTVHVH